MKKSVRKSLAKKVKKLKGAAAKLLHRSKLSAALAKRKAVLAKAAYKLARRKYKEARKAAKVARRKFKSLRKQAKAKAKARKRRRASLARLAIQRKKRGSANKPLAVAKPVSAEKPVVRISSIQEQPLAGSALGTLDKLPDLAPQSEPPQTEAKD